MKVSLFIRRPPLFVSVWLYYNAFIKVYKGAGLYFRYISHSAPINGNNFTALPFHGSFEDKVNPTVGHQLSKLGELSRSD
jgi:hypothetical protein